MTEWVIYLIEANAILAVLYLFYVLLLKKETFFNFNRFYLLSILAFSLSIPLLSLDVIPSSGSAVEQPIVAIGEKRAAYYDALSDWTLSRQHLTTPPVGDKNERSGMEPSKVVMLVLVAIYGIGAMALLIRLFWSLRWIVKTLGFIRRRP